MDFADKTLTCADCGASFPFTASEQTFYQEKGFTNEPRRCANCRTARRSGQGGGGGSYSGGGGGGGSYSGGGGYGGQREMFTVTCSQCGKDAQVPFQPRGDKPVYCSDCFRSQGSSRGGSSSRGGGGGGYGRSRY